MKNLRLIILVALVALFASVAVGAEIPYEVPDQIKALPEAQYIEVIKLHNESQYRMAEKLVVPGREFTVGQSTTTSETLGGFLYPGIGCGGYGFQNVGTYFQTPTISNSTTTTFQQTYEIGRYGGGPVWIVNPYVRP
jgi:hypothetical protein